MQQDKSDHTFTSKPQPGINNLPTECSDTVGLRKSLQFQKTECWKLHTIHT